MLGAEAARTYNVALGMGADVTVLDDLEAMMIFRVTRTAQASRPTR